MIGTSMNERGLLGVTDRHESHMSLLTVNVDTTWKSLHHWSLAFLIYK